MNTKIKVIVNDYVLSEFTVNHDQFIEPYNGDIKKEIVNILSEMIKDELISYFEGIKIENDPQTTNLS